MWLGTVHDDWGIYASGIVVDDLQITGRAFNAEEVTALRSLPANRGGALEARTKDYVDIPRPDVGDQDGATKLPGDQYEPTQLPGDQYEPTQLPGDQYEPEQIQDPVFDPHPENADRDDSTAARTEDVID
jgi:hypothetical protein